MKNRSRNYFNGILKSLAIAACISLAAPYVCAEDDPDKLADLTWVEMINSVPTGKASELVQKFQEKEARGQLYSKYKDKCNIESYRNKEVILITIPAKLLFGPNSTELLSDGAAKYLEPIKRYLKTPDMWRVMLVMHTDNTGSEVYRDRLTEQRVLSAYQWFEDQPNLDTSYLFPYALGDEYPLPGNHNETMDLRDKNRRLEIYLVPGEKMVEDAKKGRIAY